MSNKTFACYVMTTARNAEDNVCISTSGRRTGDVMYMRNIQHPTSETKAVSKPSELPTWASHAIFLINQYFCLVLNKK